MSVRGEGDRFSGVVAIANLVCQVAVRISRVRHISASSRPKQPAVAAHTAGAMPRWRTQLHTVENRFQLPPDEDRGAPISICTGNSSHEARMRMCETGRSLCASICAPLTNFRAGKSTSTPWKGDLCGRGKGPWTEWTQVAPAQVLQRDSMSARPASSTGDLNNNCDKLKSELLRSKYAGPIDVRQLKRGNPTDLLPLIHFALLGLSKFVQDDLKSKGYELFAKTDLRFLEATYKLLRSEFEYQPQVCQIPQHRAEPALQKAPSHTQPRVRLGLKIWKGIPGTICAHVVRVPVCTCMHEHVNVFDGERERERMRKVKKKIEERQTKRAFV